MVDWVRKKSNPTEEEVEKRKKKSEIGQNRIDENKQL